jgi:hypothetical protein
VALSERRELSALESIFHALPRMTRAEANHVLPAVVAGFGPAAGPLLLEGLRARKSYLRQGAALGLGAVGAADAVGPLCDLLISEPTEVWREVARALGDLGAPSALGLAERLRGGVAPEAVERIVRALAHIAGRKGREAVEAMAVSSGDARLGEPARRALALLDEVRRGDREVRDEHAPAPREYTVVRAFSRRFFEALGDGEELAEIDLEEVQAEPDDLDAGAASARHPGEDDEDEDAQPLDDADLVEEAPRAERSDGAGSPVSADAGAVAPGVEAALANDAATDPALRLPDLVRS